MTTDHGAAGFCTDHAQAVDGRTETAARVLLEHSGSSFFGGPDISRWSHRCSGCGAVLLGSSLAPRVVAVAGAVPTTALAAHQAAAVVAALDDESARLRAMWSADLANVQAIAGMQHRDAEAYRIERDAARAALDRVRALHKPVWGTGFNDYRCAECAAVLTDATPNCPTIAAALDPEEPR